MSPPPDAAAETRAVVTVTAIRSCGGWQVRRSAQVLRVRWQDGRVAGSVRSAGPGPCDDLTARLADAARRQLRQFDDGLTACDTPAARTVAVQSAQITAAARVLGWPAGDGWPTGRVAVGMLVRGESAVGPLLLGGAESGTQVSAAGQGTGWLAAGTGCAAALTAVARVIHDWRPADAGRSWQDLPLVLSPGVAAPVITGARMALASPGAAKLAGRRILHDLALLDIPDGYQPGQSSPPGETDDAGQPATVLHLVNRGVAAVPRRDPRTGLVAGRATWDHDAQRLTGPPHYRLSLHGAAGEAPQGAVRLRWCVEGIRRFHPDGTMRLLCIATHPVTGHCFRLRLTARPLSLLRTAAAVTDDTAVIYAGDTVATPSLVLPSATELGNGGIHVEEV